LQPQLHPQLRTGELFASWKTPDSSLWKISPRLQGTGDSVKITGALTSTV
jgi:hypothetical protein